MTGGQISWIWQNNGCLFIYFSMEFKAPFCLWKYTFALHKFDDFPDLLFFFGLASLISACSSSTLCVVFRNNSPKQNVKMYNHLYREFCCWSWKQYLHMMCHVKAADCITVSVPVSLRWNRESWNRSDIVEYQVRVGAARVRGRGIKILFHAQILTKFTLHTLLNVTGLFVNPQIT